jgi:hypothetical protein
LRWTCNSSMQGPEEEKGSGNTSEDHVNCFLFNKVTSPILYALRRYTNWSLLLLIGMGKTKKFTSCWKKEKKSWIWSKIQTITNWIEPLMQSKNEAMEEANWCRDLWLHQIYPAHL